MLNRRTLMGSAAGLVALPQVSFAQGVGERRLVFIFLRGALDGLAAVPPVGDPGLQRLRSSLVPDGALPLDATFALHPGLAALLPWWQARELAIVPAVASPYRDRSHFDAQHLIETGGDRPRAAEDGFLNRALAELQQPQGQRLGLAVGSSVPTMLRGATPVASWEPQVLPPAEPGLIAMVARMYAADPLLSRTLAEGVRAATMAGDVLGETAGAGQQRGVAAVRQIAGAAGKLLAAQAGPRVATLDIDGWDTHTNQPNRLGLVLPLLAEAMVALKAELTPVWRQTMVVVLTEFGRTVRPNGTNGTDHGTGSVAFLAGGAVRGGRMLGDWPGLQDGQLFENRDVRPTVDLRAVLKTALAQQLGLSSASLDQRIFPGSAAVRPLQAVV